MDKPEKIQLRIEHLWALIVLAGILIFVNTHPIRPHDFWWHITIGREILTTGKIPATDIYSYTATGQPYPAYQMYWLMEIVLYKLYQSGGPALVVFVYSLLISSAYLVIFWLCKEISNSWRIGALSVLFAAALGMNDWNIRPQGITFLLASLFLLAIYKVRKQPKWGWLIIFPAGMLIWVNSHGTFIIGFILIGLWCGAEVWNFVFKRFRKEPAESYHFHPEPFIALGITLIAGLLNPRGAGIISYIQTMASSGVVQNLVTEWAPPSLHSLMGVLFFIGLVGSGLLLVLSPVRPDIFQVATYLAFGALGLRTSRGIVWFGLVMAPTIAGQLSAISGKLRPRVQKAIASEGNRVINLALVILISLACVITLPWFKNHLPLPAAKASLISAETPIVATEVLLKQMPPARIFNAESFGSYLIWAVYPQYQDFVDPRIELFPDRVWIDYLNISNALGDWKGLLRDYGVNTLMLGVGEQDPLIQAARASNEWQETYQDSAAVIFTRR